MTSLLELVEFWAKAPTVLIASENPALVEKLWNALKHLDCEVDAKRVPGKTYGIAFVDTKAPPALLRELRDRKVPVVVVMDEEEPLPLDYAPFAVMSKSDVSPERLSALMRMFQLRAPFLTQPAPQWQAQADCQYRTQCA